MNIVERVSSILLKPVPTWKIIDAEPADAVGLMTGYLMVLAAIPAVCGFIGLSLVGVGGVGMPFHVPLFAGIVNMGVSYLLSVAAVYVLALMIDALAPHFGGVSNRVQALKVAVYASTAAMVGGIFTLLPLLGVLGLLCAVYSVYLLYTGLPVLMKSPAHKSAPYTAMVVIGAIILGLVARNVSGRFIAQGAWNAGGVSGAATVSTSRPDRNIVMDPAAIDPTQRNVPGPSRAIQGAKAGNDPKAMSAAAQNASAAAAGVLSASGAAGTTAAAGGKGAASTAVTAGKQVLDAKALKAALPAQLGDLARTSYEAQDGSALGMTASQVSADYGTGERTVRADISDLGGLGAMAAVAMGLVPGESQDLVHSERTWQEGDRTLHETYTKDGSTAERRVALRNGIMVSLTAQNIDITKLRSMAAQIDIAALEKLTRPAP